MFKARVIGTTRGNKNIIHHTTLPYRLSGLFTNPVSHGPHITVPSWWNFSPNGLEFKRKAYYRQTANNMYVVCVGLQIPAHLDTKSQKYRSLHTTFQVNLTLKQAQKVVRDITQVLRSF